jgi:PEGA domain.
MTPTVKRKAASVMTEEFRRSQTRSCNLVGLGRSIWRHKSRRPADEEDQAPPPAAERQREDAWRQRAPATTSPARQRARLLLSAQPGDAAVYLDDHFLGTAEELGLADGGVPLIPGKHTITVSRPGFKSRTVEIDIARGEAKKVDVSLDK